MTYPKLHITNGPGQRDLETAFLGRSLGAVAKFTIFIDERPMEVRIKILNLEFVTCHGSNYRLGGLLEGTTTEIFIHEIVGDFNFIFIEYNSDDRKGTMEFSNAA